MQDMQDGDNKGDKDARPDVCLILDSALWNTNAAVKNGCCTCKEPSVSILKLSNWV